ncbi:MAG: sulfatase-like hydrolase/transferase [Bacteroidota bacterium]
MEMGFLLRGFLADELSEKNRAINFDKTPLIKNKPSIYLLVMDEYTGSNCMSKELNYVNNLDSVLSVNDFHVFTNSQSNYNFTTFSILSMFEMNYLSGLDPNKISHKDYLAAERNLYKNPFLELLMHNNYEFINYSIFDFKGHPAFDHFYLLPSQMMLLRKRTFFSYVLNDLGWHLSKWDRLFWNVWQRNVYGVLKHNIDLKEEIVDLLDQPKKGKPYFLYAHFIMPHPPFFYDSTGKLREKSDVLFEMKNHIYPHSGYIANVKHANEEIIELIQAIKKKEKDNAIIMIVGDHGFRTKDTRSCRNFSNFNAIYFPQHVRPSVYPQKITLVNQFRFVYNYLSQKNEPFLPDSTHFLIDDIEE